MADPTDLAIVRFEGYDDFHAWLDEHEDDSPGLWLLMSKKGAAVTSVSYADAVEVALRHGWIDGQRRGRDEHSFLQRFTPRRAQSIWSTRNVRAVETLIAEGRMSRRGLAEVERARLDGRWERAYDGPKDAQPLPEFLAALEANPAAAEFYTTLSSQNRFAIYFRIHSAKREETKAKRIADFVAMLERGEKFY
ncbi:uncharacterized protein YdeI (YjbR/CyaY-like superfamily) [Conyzicola lurida]|uniref:Uncharacterized protein YdeI (YjbR/CyaY-like superfamily) n=1 Tax=Conyzicola lurida TaxID=1172621 RepID=A0A841ARX5_9MICO|nr:YdeI/OmpD-associated family protein [Conyzicola lurida]MBB5844323.1 uncharacterized protein YdeI (YjbR/CyaY-like superfamily) [Conyzicola lurida]